MRGTHGILNHPVPPWWKGDPRIPVYFSLVNWSSDPEPTVTFRGSSPIKNQSKKQQVFSDHVGLKMNVAQAGCFITHILFSSFFLLILKKISVSTMPSKGVSPVLMQSPAHSFTHSLTHSCIHSAKTHRAASGPRPGGPMAGRSSRRLSLHVTDVLVGETDVEQICQEITCGRSFESQERGNVRRSGVCGGGRAS